MTYGLEARGLRARSGGLVVLEVESLDVAEGSLMVIAGDAGSGKSTLAGALCGMLVASGSVKVAGAAVSGTPSRRRRQGLAVAVRDAGRITGVTVAEALRLAAGADQRAHAEAMERFPELAPRQRVPAQLLSGGEQQLLQVACAWAGRPKVLVLDAPAVGLAQRAADAVIALAHDEVARGCAVLWLDADARAAPAPPAQRLVRGRLEAAAASASDQE